MHITFIQTGGTIDKDYPKLIRGAGFEITTPAVARLMERLNPSFTYDIVPLLQKDSLELTDDDRGKIREVILETAKTRFVITHGTDTMVETGKYLESIAGKTIILTGAMRPERFANSDAPMNVGMALAGVQTLPSGVYLAMHGILKSVGEIGRDMETGQFI
ncbi:asparaginase domain-containing protein [Pontibacter sp. G13]|uniref:asparaginase domain-containing protein n=1 Tax=Pontibacter sp. G13 TaxID=3074898 RepID=UPI002889625E|nr:asparaginase domain-containing protein [Pontibacter sp. G13]WNJ20612.1 asparaginase domain-containing protein [Pontibacter sp. G13]